MTTRTCECGKTFEKRIKGCCPYCGRQVEKFQNQWVASQPPTTILEEYENLMREYQLRNGEDGFLFRIPKQLRGKEYSAALDLYMIAGMNLDIALDTLRYLAYNSSYASRFFSTSSLWQLRSDFNKCVPIIYKQREDKNRRDARTQKNLDELREKFGELFG